MKPEQREEFLSNLAKLYSHLKKELHLKTTPKVVLDTDQKNADKMLGKTGFFDPNEKSIHLFITDRHPKDILRSFSHEVVHHWQHEHKQLERGKKGEEHDPQYAQNDPWMRQMEKQAYLLGNMMFRDWEDAKKNGDKKAGKTVLSVKKENTLMIGKEYPSKKHSYKDITLNEHIIEEGLGDYLDKLGTFLLVSGAVGAMVWGFHKGDTQPGEDLVQGLPVEIEMDFRKLGGEKGEQMRQVFDEYFKDEKFTVVIDPEISDNVELDYDQKTIKVKNAEVMKSMKAFEGMMLKSILQRGAQRM